jgi:hypothetical protein
MNRSQLSVMSSDQFLFFERFVASFLYERKLKRCISYLLLANFYFAESIECSVLVLIEPILLVSDSVELCMAVEILLAASWLPLMAWCS